jgi:hypothetical protein
LAWLGCTPDKSRHSRLEQIRGNAVRERGEDGSAIVGSAEVHLPEIPMAFENLLTFFISSGQATQTGMGLTSLSWAEIKAWREENELDVTLFERDLLKKMSEAYCAEYVKASDPKRPAPYTPEIKEDEIDHVGKAMQMLEQMRLLRKT